ncbi:SH3 domain-binding glutamic acid-rich-like protein 3 [Boleophthalmus pectinirostris]|uniref:SH3 domain-binding glutamic acid-rich-like protein 3 n=1 Tax=Boleophthalmus pectinirostris TaxID=150288 RepID=UPI000A1C2F20|nr:SH3 domain-binding glutamic acid-rich-like protein 3 [Boleophthalmus pectinirostris]
MALVLYYSSVSGNTEMKKRQEKMIMVLTAKKIDFRAVDISQNSDDKDLMRKLVGDPKALPPQICRGDSYCGDFTAFENAIEEERLEAFLKM